MLILTSLATLIFVAVEAPWENPFFNWWHLLNETIFYMVCVGLLCFSGLLTRATESVTLGWLLIGVIIVMVIFNTLIILFDLLVYTRLLILRYR